MFYYTIIAITLFIKAKLEKKDTTELFFEKNLTISPK